ncbi:cystatin [Gadus morhua]|uniref:Cystatin-like n=1 Tax=Gadus morhua TaxID=8049 RepID=A0A8C5BQQ2_GADMO|nr:cystatin-like [Gadus morhua]XP_056464883.1 cystatin-like [Gadus chalcogrammus]
MIWKTLLIVAVFAVATDVAVMALKMVGGYSDATVTDTGVQDALRYAVVRHNAGTNDMYLRQVGRVISVQKQVVSGVNYKFVVEMGQTACRKTGVESNCPVRGDEAAAKPYQCTFVVYKHWSGTVSLTSQTCPTV